MHLLHALLAVGTQRHQALARCDVTFFSYPRYIAEGISPDWMSEGRLVAETQHTIHDQLVELMNEYELPLYKFLFVLAGDREFALECAQETFVRAYENLRKGKSVNAGWLYRVARNRAMDEFRHRRRRQCDLETLEHLPVEEMPSPELGLAMRQAFAHLKPDDRTILYMAAVEGRSGAEIAEVLGVTTTTARMRLSRARERFRVAYGGTV